MLHWNLVISTYLSWLLIFWKPMLPVSFTFFCFERDLCFQMVDKTFFFYFVIYLAMGKIKISMMKHNIYQIWLYITQPPSIWTHLIFKQYSNVNAWQRYKQCQAANLFFCVNVWPSSLSVHYCVEQVFFTCVHSDGGCTFIYLTNKY